MKHLMLAAALAVLPIVAPIMAQAQTQQQDLVDRATLAVEEMLSVPEASDRIATLRDARAVMICPRVFRAGFLLGGAGGGCVLTARDGSGSWSSPAFYSFGNVSLGFQAGIEDSEILMMVMSDAGLSALMDSQFKIGGDASVAFATVGAGIDASSTRPFHADIIAYSLGRGLFAGIALNGGVLTTDTTADHNYYGRDLAARQIAIQMEVNNPGADPLRAMLGRYGAPLAAHLEPPRRQALSDPAGEPAPRPLIQSAPLPPIRR
jgi:lipid-binding SYLF domain-containing protein